MATWFPDPRPLLRTPRGYVYTAALVVSLVRYVLILTLFPQFNGGERLFFSALSFVGIAVMWEGVHAFNQYLNRRLPFETGVFRRFLIQSGGCLAVMLVLHTFLIIRFERYYSGYFPPQFATAIKVASYFLDVFVVVAVNTAYFGFYFFEKWKKNLVERQNWEKEKALLQQERLTAQYENLKNQLNPHFLFNSLASLHSLIHDEPALASQFLQQLSRVFRYVLENRDSELVTLETELRFITRYQFLLTTRFGHALQMHTTIEESALPLRLVPVTLQILLENAIKHNTLDPARPLHIRISAHGGRLTVENTRNPKKRVEASNKVGLENLKALYGYLSGQSVEIIETDSNFTVKIPLL